MKLSKAAMLVSVNIVNGGLLGERRDREASELVETTYSTAPRRAKASKYLIDRKHQSVKDVVAATQRVRETLYRYTVPWGDDKGMRLLPVKAHAEFKARIERDVAELKQSWDSYVKAYPHLKEQSKHDLGMLFDDSQYPDAERVLSLFRLELNYWPFPDSSNFVAEIAASAAKEAREAIEEATERRLEAAAQDLVARVKETVTAYVDKLMAYRLDPDTNKYQAVFRDSVVINCVDLADLLTKLNVTNNREVDNLSNELKRLARFTAEELRNNSEARAVAIAHGQSILGKLEVMAGRDSEVNEMVAGVSNYMDD